MGLAVVLMAGALWRMALVGEEEEEEEEEEEDEGRWKQQRCWRRSSGE
jgi:hypothetical protein